MTSPQYSECCTLHQIRQFIPRSEMFDDLMTSSGTSFFMYHNIITNDAALVLVKIPVSVQGSVCQHTYSHRQLLIN